MEKVAQRRGLINRLRGVTDVGGRAAEIFSPAFSKIMDDLRAADEKVRQIVTDANLKDILKEAKSQFNRREYMTAVSKLKSFHDKVAEVYTVLNNFKMNIDKVHEQFLFHDLDEETKKSLTGLKQKFEAKAAIKNAGISDIFHNLTTDRGVALKTWEKRYPNQIKKLKADTESLIKKSLKLYSELKSALVNMDKFVSIRKPEQYLQSAGNFISQYKEYDEEFKQYYIGNIKNFVEKLQLHEAPTVPVPAMKDMQKVVISPNAPLPEPGKQEFKAAPQSDVDPTGNTNLPAPGSIGDLQKQVEEMRGAPSSMPPSIDSDEEIGARSDAIAREISEAERLEKTHMIPVSSFAPNTLRGQPDAPKYNKEVKPVVENKIVNVSKDEPEEQEDVVPKKADDEPMKFNTNRIFPGPAKSNTIPVSPAPPTTAHQSFLATLKVLSSSPKLMAQEIVKYANAIAKTDPASSKQLLSIASKIE